jgi:hypothetical protein
LAPASPLINALPSQFHRNGSLMWQSPANSAGGWQTKARYPGINPATGSCSSLHRTSWSEDTDHAQ